MNFDLLKKTTLEDYERRLNNVLPDIELLEKEKTGLFKRIVNFDRQLLYGCMGKVLRTSQCSQLQNRDELSYFESICHFFHYYMYDDGELCIKWHKYDLDKGDFVSCSPNTKLAQPYLDYYNYEDEQTNNKIAREKEVLWLLDWHEKKQEKYIQDLKKEGMYDGSMDNKEFIDYLKETRKMKMNSLKKLHD